MKTLSLTAATALLAALAAAGDRPIVLEWDGEARFRPEAASDLDLDAGSDDERAFVHSRFRLGATARKGSVSAMVQVQDSRTFGDETSTSANERNVDLHQGWVEIAGALGTGSEVRIGRQEWAYGDERVLGAFGWDNVGRSFDGVRARWKRGARTTVDLLWARTGRVVADGRETNQDLFGVYLTHPYGEGAGIDAYALGLRDGRRQAGERSGESGRTFVGAAGLRWKARLDRLDLRAEGIVETGEWRGDELDAWAWAGEAGVTLGDDVVVRPFAGLEYATGDEDPGDGKRQETFNFFPTNHPLYGYADRFGWRNLVGPYGGLELSRKARRAVAKVHDFRLDQARGPWKSAGGDVLGFDPEGRSGRHVGRELDVAFWTPLGADGLTLHGGWSRFWPRRFARSTRGEDPFDFGYLQLVWRFKS